MSIATPLTAPPQRYSVVNWITCIVMVLFHVGAVAALFHFSWTLLFVSAALYWVAVGLGISMGYHRLHTHRGFKTPKLFEYFLAVCGTLTLEGGPIFWVADHRLHHQHSDSRSIRTRRASAGSGRTWAGLSSARATTTTRRSCRATRPTSRRTLLPLVEHVSLGAADRAGIHPARHRRMAARQLGDFPARGGRPARDVARQLRHAHVGRAALRDARTTRRTPGGSRC